MEKKDAPFTGLLDRLTDRKGEPDPDEILSLFLEYTDDMGFELYPAQEEAVLELLDYKHVMLNTPTGSGRTRKSFLSNLVLALSWL